jgi:predicted MFS family arabinose efflux permease
VASGAGTIFALYGAIFGVLFLMPAFLQYVQLRSTFASGLALLPLGVGLGLVAPFSGRAMDRIGVRGTIVWSLVAMVGATLMLATLAPDTPVLVVLVATGVFGACFGLSITAATATVLNDLPVAKAGDGGAVNQLARQVGAAFGVATVGGVFAAIYADRVEPATTRLSAAGADTAEGSIEGARAIAAKLSDGAAQALTTRADDAFDTAARFGLGVCVAMLVLAALGAMVGLRAQSES